MFIMLIYCLMAGSDGSQQPLVAKAPIIESDSTIYLNINFMNRGYCYAYSTQPKTQDPEFNGWADSDNIPVKITDPQIRKGVLQIIADTSKHVPYAGKFKGFRLSVCNTTGDTVMFKAQDSRLYLKLQAKNKKGEWADIEYLPSSTCGNSYHKLKLESGSQWNFVIPDYRGSFQTRIRARLAVTDNTDPAKENIIYSNEFNGSVNPGQFTDKKEYDQNGLMDPYEN